MSNLEGSANPRIDLGLRRRVPDRARRLARRLLNWCKAKLDPSRATTADLRGCYRLLLGRQPDQHGWDSYAARVQRQGIAVDDLVRDFLTSVEFKSRFRSLALERAGSLEEVSMRDGLHLVVRRSDSSGVGRALRSGREYEPHVTRRLREVLCSGDTFVDVGASYGYFSLVASRAVGPTGRVIAFEPGAENVSLLHLNLYANGASNVEVHPIAVADRPGLLLYSSSGGNGQVAPFDGDAGALETSELVAADTLDRVLSDTSGIKAIKIDVEGAEGLALEGSRRVLGRFRPYLFFEFSAPSIAAVSGIEPEAPLQLLERLGYNFEVLTPNATRPGPVSVAELVELGSNATYEHLDIAATPQADSP
ncbi:MAG TPA: FkbM family methyltransferase [Acidimicrobiales bacterium]|nr:FkbM family methyltransferase [Acidimicrobiales bacterium]